MTDEVRLSEVDRGLLEDIRDVLKDIRRDIREEIDEVERRRRGDDRFGRRQA